MTQWNTPDEDGNIHIPEELVDLVNLIAMQVNLMIRGGKNEVQAICDITCIAQAFFLDLAQTQTKTGAEFALLEEDVKEFIEPGPT